MAEDPRSAPRGIPLLGHAPAFFRQPIDFPVQCREQHGDLVQLQLARRDALLLGHPEHVSHVLVQNADNYRKGELYREELGFLGNGLLVSEGADWERQRQQLASLFQPVAIEGHKRLISDRATALAARLPTDEPVAIDEYLQELSLHVIADAMLGIDLSDRAPMIRECLADVMSVARASSRFPISVPDWVPTPANRQYNRAMARFESVVDEIIDDRRKETGDATDVVSHLLSLQENAPDVVTDAEIRDQILTLLLAGHDTTALGMAYTLSLLARHPDEQSAVFDSISAASSETVPDRLEWAISESLRLYPPTYLFLREAIGDDRIDDVSVAPGTIMIVHPWMIHRDDRFFDQSDAFIPDRWADNLESSLHSFAYFPFGGGRRRCIGGHFALLEMRTVLAELLNRFHFEPTDANFPELEPRITLRPKESVELIARDR